MKKEFSNVITADNCVYPDNEGGFINGKHKFGKDGYCIFCGHRQPETITFKIIITSYAGKKRTEKYKFEELHLIQSIARMNSIKTILIEKL